MPTCIAIHTDTHLIFSDKELTRARSLTDVGITGVLCPHTEDQAGCFTSATAFNWGVIISTVDEIKLPTSGWFRLTFDPLVEQIAEDLFCSE